MRGYTKITFFMGPIFLGLRLFRTDVCISAASSTAVAIVDENIKQL